MLTLELSALRKRPDVRQIVRDHSVKRAIVNLFFDTGSIPNGIFPTKVRSMRFVECSPAEPPRKLSPTLELGWTYLQLSGALKREEITNEVSAGIPIAAIDPLVTDVKPIRGERTIVTAPHDRGGMIGVALRTVQGLEQLHHLDALLPQASPVQNRR